MSIGSTGGDYSYIEVGGTSRAPKAPPAGGLGPTALQNRLSATLFGGLEHSSALQRLVFVPQTVAAGATATIELELLEDRVDEAIFYLNNVEIKP